METKKETSQRWDDVVFENRNKDYGAYSIRKSYSQNVNKGFMMALGIAMLFFIIPMIASSFRSIDKNDSPGKELAPFTVDITPPTIEPQKQEQPKPEPQKIKKVLGNTFTVTNKPVSDELIEKLDASKETVQGSDEGVDADQLKLDGTGVSDVPPAVVEPAKPEPTVILTGIQADYKGGMQAMYKFLGKHLRYPAVARRMGIEGTVFVSFIVNTDGKVINASVIKGISKECDEEAIRVVNLMDGWIPAEQNNRKVMVKMVLPIGFHLEV